MVPLGSLWLPIILSAVIVFFAAFALHTIVPHHRTDYSKAPDEEALLEALRSQGIGRGQYHFPHVSSPAEMKDPAYVEKAERGPMGLLYVMEPTVGPSGKQLGLYFVYCVGVSVFAGYLAGATLPAGAAYLSVFRVVGTAAILGYAGALFSDAIWFGHTWSSTWKHVIDGVIYGLLTAGTFGWLWPAV
ncbi:MAG: hypothetical protein ACE5JR_05610 [Gemmatimonadota bacterium]